MERLQVVNSRKYKVAPYLPPIPDYRHGTVAGGQLAKVQSCALPACSLL